jgi:hypothetical protein
VNSLNFTLSRANSRKKDRHGRQTTLKIASHELFHKNYFVSYSILLADFGRFFIEIKRNKIKQEKQKQKHI